MKQTKILQYGIAILLATAWLVSSGAVQTANAQAKTGEKSKSNLSNQGGRDPFRKYEPPRVIDRLA
jgi:hypothetical protein